jgi:tRNA(Ile)-lysidine synthase
MSLLKQFEENTRRQNLFSPKDKLLVAVSGGVDSVVLCELCKQAGYDFSIAHCNFQLRGEESERDEQFVRALGKNYHVDVAVKRFDTEKYAAEKKISVQEAARELRYSWFAELVSDQFPVADIRNGGNVIYLLTAHHADDNAETVLMNFCRGTGLHGMTGIPAAADTAPVSSMPRLYIRRPLLPFAKADLIAFARENKLGFAEDSSNYLSKYTRNLFRNEIIPAISKVYPQVKENLQDNINRFREIEKLYQRAVGELKMKLCRPRGKEIHIPIKQLMEYESRALIYEIISPFGFSEKQVEEVIKLAKSESGRYIQSPTRHYRIIRHRHWLLISPAGTTEAGNIIIEERNKEIQFAGGILHFEKAAVQQPDLHFTAHEKSRLSALLDADKIEFPLLLRKWKTGDYFYPLGMKKKKKLARFFIDQKLSKPDKEKVWVLEMNKKIIWVIGHRIDDRFKITDRTKKTMKITLVRGTG